MLVLLLMLMGSKLLIKSDSKRLKNTFVYWGLGVSNVIEVKYRGVTLTHLKEITIMIKSRGV